MEERIPETSHRSRASGSARYRLNHSRSRTHPQEDLKDPFQVVSAFSYVTSPSNTRNSAKTIHKESKKKLLDGMKYTSVAISNENSKRQPINEVYSQQGKISPPAGPRTGSPEQEKHGLSDWLLLGKSVQDPTCYSPDKTHHRKYFSNEAYLVSSRLKNEEGHKYPSCAGLHTHPPSVEKCPNPQHGFGKVHSDGYLEANGPRLPSFSSRPLGEPWMSYSDWQKSRHKPNAGEKKLLDNMMAAAAGPGPLNYCRPLSAELRRTSSQGSLKNCGKISRSRSASLPVQTKLKQCRVVFDWKENKSGGVTYVTPFLQNAEPEGEEPACVSSLTDRRQSTARMDDKLDTRVAYSKDKHDCE